MQIVSKESVSWMNRFVEGLFLRHGGNKVDVQGEKAFEEV